MPTLECGALPETCFNRSRASGFVLVVVLVLVSRRIFEDEEEQAL
jgi:hypothetical protein